MAAPPHQPQGIVTHILRFRLQGSIGSMLFVNKVRSIFQTTIFFSSVDVY